jgi:hypothetical protein
VNRLTGGSARWKDRKVDVLQYLGEENPAGTIFLVRHPYQIQRDPLFTPQLCCRRAGAIAFEEQLTKERRPITRGQRKSAAADKISGLL